MFKRFEESLNDGLKYGRTIVRENLHYPTVELCLVCLNEVVIHPVVEKVRITRVWTRWPPFDSQIRKFVWAQWLAVSEANLDEVLVVEELWALKDEV